VLAGQALLLRLRQEMMGLTLCFISPPLPAVAAVQGREMMQEMVALVVAALVMHQSLPEQVEVATHLL
tara:strand:- start:304 stop:507 length:204 start_codon:yes stop_codon:yes gene_type:complete